MAPTLTEAVAESDRTTALLREAHALRARAERRVLRLLPQRGRHPLAYLRARRDLRRARAHMLAVHQERVAAASALVAALSTPGPAGRKDWTSRAAR